MFFVETYQFTRMQCQSNTLFEPQVHGNSNTTLRYSPVVAKGNNQEETKNFAPNTADLSLESESNSKSWDLSSGLASHLNKCMSINVPEKSTREKNLQNNPFPRNLKICQRLDEYIKKFN